MMVNERLKDAMLRDGLTPESLADKLGVSAKTAERWVTLSRIPYPRHRHAVAAALRERESYLWPEAVTAEHASRVSESECVKVYPRRAAVPLDLWSRLANQAVSEIGILVFSGLFLPEQVPQIVRLLREKALDGANVRILLGDPDSEAVSNRGAEEGIGEAMASKVRNVLAFYRPLQGVEGVSIKYHSTTLYNSIYRFDTEMLVNTHAYGFPAAHSPVLHLRRLSSGELFDTYADSFDRVWSGGTPVW